MSKGSSDLQSLFTEVFGPITPVVFHEGDDDGSGFNPFPKEKREKYDRQIRLWGGKGQMQIDSCSVLLLGATAVGCETLKNLVLPGIGNVLICDNKKVTERDLGVNFYVRQEDLGKDIAHVTAKVLKEMNDDESVKVNFMVGDPKKMADYPDAFEDYDFVIASQMDLETLRKLCDICKERQKCLIAVGSVGMCGYMRVFAGNHVIIESKLDNPVEDLRLYRPWADLQKFADIQNLEEMNDKDHTHTPYPVILLQVAKKWRAEHDGKLPDDESDEEKAEFKENVKKLARKWGIQDNFLEAYNKAYQAYRELEIPEAILEYMKTPKCQFDNIDSETPLFWILMYGMKMFYENEGEKKVLPFPGIVGDMDSDTSRFLRLKSLYRRKHRADVNVVIKYLHELCEKKGLVEPSKPEVAEFCKHSYNLRCVDFRTIGEELNFETFKKEHLELMFMQGSTGAMFYCCMRAADLFFQKNGKYPGQNMDDDLEKEGAEMYELVKDLITVKWKLGLDFSQFKDEDFRKYAACWTRFGASEIHTISSLIGGVASQELIKICTKQRLCINHTWIYNGMDSTSVTMDL